PKRMKPESFYLPGGKARTVPFFRRPRTESSTNREDYERSGTARRTSVPCPATAAPLLVRARTEHGSPPRLRSAGEADCRTPRPLLHPGHGRCAAVAQDSLRDHRRGHARDF